MAAEPNAVEQAVSRALRDNLEKIQRTADELHQAVNDLVSACASSRASNALPSMVRAQTSAAALSATLEVLSRFVTGALQPPARMPFETDIFRAPSIGGTPPAPAIFEQPPPPPAHPREESLWAAPAPVVPPPVVPEIAPPVEAPAPIFSEMPPVAEMRAAVESAPAPVVEPAEHAVEPVVVSEPVHEPVHVPEPVHEPVPEPVAQEAVSEPVHPPAPEAIRIPIHEAASEPEFELELPIELQPAAAATPAPPTAAPAGAAPHFDLDSLPPEEQELHRRAFRVAKVSMQDIRMLRPDDVRLGRQNKDLCFRLRDDIEKAHKEYDRRFQAIQGHPVDYFYDWMVEILAGGDPQALGEYPYPSPVLRR